MTTPEFSKEFDILYDNANNAAPGLNEYDKSVVLTQAQEELVKNYYSGFNQVKQGFESSENRRKELSQLVKDYTTSVQVVSAGAISSGSKFYEIPEETFYIVFEEIKLISADTCLNDKFIEVKPITHDEYNKSIKNPFRKPNKRKAWRLDISNKDSKKVVEIISAYSTSDYHCRYIKKPSPIILTDFESDPDLQGMSLTIGGLNVVTECELNDEIHRDILNRGVELAIRAYRENALQSNVQLNTRNV